MGALALKKIMTVSLMAITLLVFTALGSIAEMRTYTGGEIYSGILNNSGTGAYTRIAYTGSECGSGVVAKIGTGASGIDNVAIYDKDTDIDQYLFIPIKGTGVVNYGQWYNNISESDCTSELKGSPHFRKIDITEDGIYIGNIYFGNIFSSTSSGYGIN